jgi:hypothetical protein
MESNFGQAIPIEYKQIKIIAIISTKNKAKILIRTIKPNRAKTAIS